MVAPKGVKMKIKALNFAGSLLKAYGRHLGAAILVANPDRETVKMIDSALKLYRKRKL